MLPWRETVGRAVLGVALVLGQPCLAQSLEPTLQPFQALDPSVLAHGETSAIPGCAAMYDESRNRMAPTCGMQAYTPAEDLQDRATLAFLGRRRPLMAGDLTSLELGELKSPPPNEPWPQPVDSKPDEQRKRWEVALRENPTRADKEVFLPRQEPLPVWTMPVRGVPIGAPWSMLVDLSDGGDLEVEILSVTAGQGMGYPDPELFVLRTEGEGDPEVGQLVAHQDDRPEGLPKVSLRALPEGRYRILVSGYTQANGGWMDVKVTVGQEARTIQRAAFGGIAMQYRGVRLAEPFFVGAYGHSGAIRHDTFVVLMPLEAGGRYQASNNDLGLFPRVLAPQHMERALLLVGSFAPGQRPRGRVVRAQGNPSPVGHRDLDGDGLAWDVERLLGTCDGVEDAVAGLCKAPSTLPWGWSPADTDNDGATDLEEVFGIRRCFPSAPKSPLFGIPSCLQGRGGRCISECPAGSTAIWLPWSALGSPLPTRHDVYLELDWWTHELPATRPALDSGQLARLTGCFNKAWTHPDEEAPGFTQTSPVIKLHVYLDDLVGGPNRSGSAHIPAAGLRYAFFNQFFEPSRRYTGLFYYMLAKSSGAGQSDVNGRSAIIGVAKRGVTVTNLLHELGHLLGLQHNGHAGTPTNTPFYLSIMSYAYAHSLPPPVLWKGELVSCTAGGGCGAGMKCATFKGRGSYCLPDCGAQDDGGDVGVVFERLSAGQLRLPVGTSETQGIPEDGYPEWFVPYYYCAAVEEEAGRDRLSRLADPRCPDGRCVQCDKSSCRIDWNRDGIFLSSPADVDGDGELSSQPMGDLNDLVRIIEIGRSGPWTMVRRWMAFFYMSFEAGRFENLLPYPVTISPTGARRVEDVTNWCSETGGWRHCRDESRGRALWFPGSEGQVRGLEVHSASGWCVPMSEGMTLSLRVKPLRWEAGTVLLDSPHVALVLSGTAAKPVWLARLGFGGRTVQLELEDPGALGQWSRLTLQVDSRRGDIQWHVRRGTVHLTALAKEPAVNLAELCQWSIGSAMGEVATWRGAVDDPIWVAGPVPEM